MIFHPVLIRLSALLPLSLALLAMLVFAFQFNLIAEGGPSRSLKDKLELEELTLIGATLCMILGALAVINRTVLVREFMRRQLAEKEAGTDPLTGLSNRRHFIEVAEALLTRTTAKQSSCALLLVDLDRFKAINDTYGHAAGDAVLVAVGDRIGEQLPALHCAARLGGDEFAVLIGPSDRLPIDDCVKELIARIAEPIRYRSDQLNIGASIGIAIAPDDGDAVATLLAAADQRMYARKVRRGRLRVVSAA